MLFIKVLNDDKLICEYNYVMMSQKVTWGHMGSKTHKYITYSTKQPASQMSWLNKCYANL